MRRARSFVVLALAGLLGVATAAHADFDPTGKKKPKKPPISTTVKKPPKPPTSASASSSTGEETAAPKKDPIKKAAIIAMARPGEVGPVLKLASLYRDRDGS